MRINGLLSRSKALLPFFSMVIVAVGILLVPVFIKKPAKAYAEEPGALQDDVLYEALYYEKRPDNEVKCLLCPNKCVIEEGDRGDCRTRENRDGTLYTLVYGKPVTLSLEPIEKAPFYHVKPGQTRLCIATVGCNLRCKYCQNWEISQKKVEEVPYYLIPPEDVVDAALYNEASLICFTFSEPVVFYEYMYDIATLAQEAGLHTAMVSNGYINEEPLRRLCQVMDAIKVDLKAFTEAFYEDITDGELEPVLEAMGIIREEDVWLEIVNLVVPSLNDDAEEIREMCEWIVEKLGPDVPVHFTRFYPQYRLTNVPATPIDTLVRAHDIAIDSGIQHVYVGNVPGHQFNSTFCPTCGTLLIERVGFSVVSNHMRNGSCPNCDFEIAGFW